MKKINLDGVNEKMSEHLEALFGDENDEADKVAGLLYMQRDLILKEVERALEIAAEEATTLPRNPDSN